MIEQLIKTLRRHEGFRERPYKDTKGKLTIGYGRNLADNGVSREEAEIMLRHDVATAMNDARDIFPDFEEYAAPRQVVLVSMLFNMGRPRFMGFENLIAAVQARDWSRAAMEMVRSRWFEQVGIRARELTEMMETGKTKEAIRTASPEHINTSKVQGERL
jgi:lysozyme